MNFIRKKFYWFLIKKIYTEGETVYFSKRVSLILIVSQLGIREFFSINKRGIITYYDSLTTKVKRFPNFIELYKFMKDGKMQRNKTPSSINKNSCFQAVDELVRKTFVDRNDIKTHFQRYYLTVGKNLLVTICDEHTADYNFMCVIIRLDTDFSVSVPFSELEETLENLDYKK